MAEPPGFLSLLLHFIFFYSTSPQIYHLAQFSSRKCRKKEGNYSRVLIGGPRGGGEGWGGVLWRKGSEKCDSCKCWRGEKKGGMSVIDSDDRSRMAVFPRGGDSERIPARVTEAGGRDKGRDGGGGGGVEHISCSVSHTHTHTSLTM